MNINWRHLITTGALLAAAALAGCGGSGGGGGNENPAEPVAKDPAGSATVGGAAQTEPVTITGVNGAQLVVPPGALEQAVTVRIAADSSGAPALPAGITPVGPIYALTPHESYFAAPLELRLPKPAITLNSNQKLVIAKASAGGQWAELLMTEERDGLLIVPISSFSYVVPVVTSVTASSDDAWEATVRASCDGQNCGNLVGPVNVTLTVSTNGGRLPEDCGPQAQLTFQQQDFSNFQDSTLLTPANPVLGSATAGGSLTERLAPDWSRKLRIYIVSLTGCRTPRTVGIASVWWRSLWSYRAYVDTAAISTQDLVAGGHATAEAILVGGTTSFVEGRSDFRSGRWYPEAPTSDEFATVDWERSDDGGHSWRLAATSYQNLADPSPFGSAVEPWLYWRVKHEFHADRSFDGRVLLRARACVDARVQASATSGVVRERRCKVSAIATANVLQAGTAPSFTTLPRAQLVLTGQTASFSAQASGLPAPTLQWQTRPANSSGAWTDVPAAQGGTNPNFTTPPLALADNGVQYRVVASNSGGSTESPPVSVSVSDQPVAPTIAADLVAIRALKGGDATFAVGVRGTEPLNYQWRVNGQVVSGQNAPVLSLQAVQSAATVQLTVSNAAGSAQSRAVDLQVFDGAVPEAPVTIDLQPRPLTVETGQTAVFAVRATGGGSLHYRWQFQGQDLPGAADSPALVLESAQLDQSGSYRVIVSNSVSSVTSDAVALQVNPTAPPTPLFILQQPVGLALNAGQTATFAVVAEGTGALSYQWLREGSPLPGATRPVLTLSPVAPGDAGDYQVLVSHAAGGTVRSNAAALVVTPAPGAPAVSMPSLVADAIEGQPLRIAMQVTGTPAPRCLWLKNGALVPDATDCSGLDLSTPALADHGSVYTGVAFNAAGAAVGGPVVLHVAGAAAPAIVAQPADASAAVGGNGAFLASASGSPLPQVQWLVNGQVLPMTPPSQPTMTVGACTFDFDALPTILALRNVTAGCDGAQVVYRATNVLGSAASRTARLTVTAAVPPGALTGTQVVAGHEWSMVLRPDRTVWAWGGFHRTDGVVQISNLASADQARRPVRMYPASLGDVRQIAGWYDSFWALKGEPGSASARVLHWGNARSGSDGRGADGAGNLGTPPNLRFNAAPVELLERRSVNGVLQAVPVDRVCSLAGTAGRVLMIRALDAFGVPTDCAPGSAKTVWVAGTLTAFGSDAVGVVVAVQGLWPGVPAKVIAAQHTAQSTSAPVMVVMEDGTAAVWGTNIGNQFGLVPPADTGYLGSNAAPFGLRGAWVAARDAAFSYVGLLVLRNDGNVLVSGRNDGGELGVGPQDTGTINNGPLFALTQPAAALDSVDALASTQAQVSLALRQGRILAWGAANQPLQGGSTARIDYPRLLPASGDGWRALSAGHTHALVIAANGAVYTWGSGLRGALGNGVDGGSALAPTLVSTP